MKIDQTFDSFAAFTHFATHAPSRLAPDARASRAEGSYRTDFTGTASFADAVRLAECGWAEGRQRIASLSAAVYEKVGERILRPELTYDVCGDAWDMGRVLSGEPECAMRWQETEVPVAASGKVVRIVVNGTASWSVTREVLFTRGAAICALVDALEASGRRCEVTVATCITASASRLTTRIITKAAGDALQPETLAFALAHASNAAQAVLLRVGDGFANGTEDVPHLPRPELRERR